MTRPHCKITLAAAALDEKFQGLSVVVGGQGS